MFRSIKRGGCACLPCLQVLLLSIITSGSALGASQFVISGYVQTSVGTGVGGVSVAGDSGATSAVTGADGYYSVTVPNHWSGTITASKAGWLITPASKTYSRISADVAGENYAAYQPKISGYVRRVDGTGLSGTTVSASGGGSTTTNASGYYEIGVPYGWSGTLSATLAGYSFTATDYANVTTDQTDQDFAGYQPRISGYVRKADGTGLSGATVSASAATSTTTGTDGYYDVVVPYNWSGTVSASLAGFGFTPRNYSNVITDQGNQDFTGFQPTISGVVTAYGAALDGVTLTASNGGGTGVTDSAGSYSLAVPYGWSGAITPSKPQYSLSPSRKNYTIVTADAVAQNYAALLPPVYITGYVRDSNGTGIAAASITANNNGGSTVTDSSGYYSRSVPYNWSGTVTAKKFKWQITPADYSYSNLSGNRSDQNFAANYVGIIVKADHTGNFATIQAAIDAAVNGDVIVLQSGIYTGDGNRDIDFKGKAIAVKGATSDPNNCVIDCQGSLANLHRGFKFVSGETETSVLEGVKITNGFGPKEHVFGDAYEEDVGGAIYCNQSSPSINNCVITNNSCSDWGGAIFNYMSSPHISNCTISSNRTIGNISASDEGGGICNYIRSSPSIDNCTLGNNSASWGGAISNYTLSNPAINNCVISGNSALCAGGIYNEASSSPTIYSCRISDNTASYGAGIYSRSYCSPVISNCIIRDNSASVRCGAIFDYDDCSSTVSSCTISDNYAAGYGGGIDIHNSIGSTMNSCIVWGNQPSQIYGSANVRYCDIQGGFAGDGNIDTDPLFAADGLHLTSLSRCINSGDPDYIAQPGETDIDGDPRILSGRKDMGADEVTSIPMLNLSGHVRKADETLLNGVVISASNGGGSAITNSGGYYELVLPFNWSGTLTATLAGYNFTAKNYTNVTADKVDQDFIGTQPKVSGYVNRGLDGLPVTDVNAVFSAIGTTTTNGQGYFGFEVPAGWSGTMSLSKAGMEGRIITFTNVTSDVNSTYLVNVTYGGGTGSVSDPYRMESAEHLYWLSRQMDHWGKSFVLMNDVDMNEPQAAGFRPIGNVYNGVFRPFSGSFDGGSHVIRNLGLTEAAGYAGLFGRIQAENTQASVIRNVGLANASVTGDHELCWNAGSLAGSIRGWSGTWNVVVENCWSEGGKVEGDKHVGGLIGLVEDDAMVRRCFANTAVHTNNGGGGLVGGLAGGTVSNCAAICDVNSPAFDVGGLIGAIYHGDVSDCYAKGSVKGRYESGGFAGINGGGSISRCYAICTVSGQRNTGGFVGQAVGVPGSLPPVFEGCFWDSDICQDVNGIGNVASPGVAAKSSAEMRSAVTFAASGWDFTGETVNGTADIWTICEGTNTPRLLWQVPSADFICPDGVNYTDFAFFAQHWLLNDCTSANNYCGGADMDASGHVDMADLEVLAGQWLEGM
jgi:hypothetical protein